MLRKKCANMAVVRDYQPLKEAISDISITTFRELCLRYVVIFCGLVLAYIETGDLRVGVFMGLYFVTSLCYTYGQYYRKKHKSQNSAVPLFILFAITTLSFTGSVINFFSYGSVLMVTIGLFAGVMQGMYNLARHQRFNLLVFWDTFLVICQAVVLCLLYLRSAESPIEKSVIVFCVLGASFYFTHAQYRSVKIRDVLRKAHDEAMQAQKMRAVGQLTAGISHDFNNLLTVIRGNIELAEMSQSKEEMAERLCDAKSSADQASSLVSQLLAFSRKAQLQFQDVDMQVFLDESRRVMERVLPAGITVEVSLDEDLKFLHSDENLLRSTLLNLVINARDAMKENGFIKIRCGIADEEMLQGVGLKFTQQKQYGFLQVSDTGSGIPKRILANVTEPFFTTKPVGEGSGLGLSSAKGFAEQSGGGIHIGHTSQGGASITLFLPIKS